MAEKCSVFVVQKLWSIRPFCPRYSRLLSSSCKMCMRYGSSSANVSHRLLPIGNIRMPVRVYPTQENFKSIRAIGMKSFQSRSDISQMRVCQLHCTVQLGSRWCADNPHANPLDDLKQLVDSSAELLPEKDLVFQPSLAEVEGCQKIFLPKTGRKVEAHKGVVDLKDLPPVSLPEVCFVGRSNVGKSSLIKSLFFATPDVKRISVSKKAGHTRTLKFYSLHKRFSLVDMPGYGYNMPEYYVESVEEYLKSRVSLQRVFLLIDGSAGITSTDEIGINMLEEVAKPYTIVLTKIDKSSHGRVLRNLMTVHQYRQEHMSSCFSQPFLVSAHSGAGLSVLRTFIAYVTGNVSLQGI